MNSQSVPLSQYGRLFGKYLAFQRGRIVLLALVLFSSIGLQLINPQILRFFIDAARNQSPLDSLLQAALLFFAIALVGQLFSIAAGYVSQLVGFTATNRMRGDLALHCLRLDMSFHNRRTPGEMIQRIDGDIATLGNLLSNLALIVIGNTLLLIAILIVLWLQEWRLGLALTVWAVAGVWALNLTRVRAVPRWREVSQAGAEYWGFLEERLGGIEDIRANGAVPFALRRMALLIRKLYLKNRVAHLLAAASVNTYLAVFVVGNLIALGFGGYLYTQGVITLGTVYLVFTYTSYVVIPLRELANQFQYLQQAGASVNRVQELFSIQSKIQEHPDQAHLPPGALGVEFEHISFAYGESGSVLDDISFQLLPGRVLGVLGRTGSGKTTLSRLLFRLYDPTHGHLRVGGVNAERVLLAELRRRIALVTQEVQLFHATVRENVALFDGRIPDEQIVQAFRGLGLGEWLESLPQGLDTMLTSGGGNLSAGQGQLVALARVLLRDPSLVILDEASSRLDPATEHLIEQAVDRLLAGRTGIVIAHHLATVHRADEVLILEDGQVREHGDRQTLARDPNSRFHHLLQTGLEEVLV